MKHKSNFTKILMLVLALTLVCFSFNVCAEEVEETPVVIELQINNPIMTVNGVETEIDPGRGTAPVIVENRTLVPIRAIIEALGGTVGWDGEKSEVTLTIGEDVVKLVIDSHYAYFNGEENILDVAPTTINDRTMLPIRYIAESFKFNVGWDDATSIVTVTKGNVENATNSGLVEFDDSERFEQETTEEEETTTSPYDGERIVDDGYDNQQEETVEEEYYDENEPIEGASEEEVTNE